MLIVKAEARPSRIHGLGLFAVEDIAKDAVIWEFTEGIDTMRPTSWVENLLEPLRSELLKYSCEQIEDLQMQQENRIGTGWMCITVGPIRYTNHSDRPNTYEVPIPHKLTRTHARRLIRAGEEITANYRQIDARWRESVPDI